MAKNSAGSDPMRRASKFLSLVLRHDPGAAGVQLDEKGWPDIGELLAGMATAGMPLSSAELERIVAEDSKSRYALANGRIRANQGHSLDVDLGLSAVAPPPVLSTGPRAGSSTPSSLPGSTRATGNTCTCLRSGRRR